ncbi:hypothetical protein E2C01_097180 [Portunus trituberculatus]|uniref:Uncharacterized protein n=1 Tax=Portunus trituberculatus TaxID=210409 RepID=A0A5B7K515_PORTR|nr:hypothetical protein [Portunus trituberculatus]
MTWGSSDPNFFFPVRVLGKNPSINTHPPSHLPKPPSHAPTQTKRKKTDEEIHLQTERRIGRQFACIRAKFPRCGLPTSRIEQSD